MSDFLFLFRSPVGRGVFPHVVCISALNALVNALEGLSVLALIPLLMSLKASTIEGNPEIWAKVEQYFPFEPVFLNLALGVLLMLCLKGVLQVLVAWYLSVLQVDLELRCRLALADGILQADLGYLNELDSGHTTNVMVSETRFVGISLALFVQFIDKIFRNLVYIALLMMISWQLTLLTVAVSAVFYLSLRPADRMSRTTGRLIALVNSDIQSLVSTVLRGVRSIKSMAAEHSMFERLHGLLLKNRRNQVLMAIVGAGTQALFEPVALVIVILAFWVFPELSITSIAIFLISLNRAYTSLRALQGIVFRFNRHAASLNLYRALDTGLLDNRARIDETGEAFERLQRSLVFESVVFRFQRVGEAQRFELGPLDMEFPRGQMTALVGRSGSGKSTCVDLLVGLVAAEQGRVLIDGRDIAEFDVRSVREKVGYVTQEPFVLNASAAENIAFPQPVDMARVRRAAAMAYADEFIEQMPTGYETSLGDHGARLSGGQRQRIALARALYREPQILILDEATSALDGESEQYVMKSIHALHGKLTIIMITHRLSSVVEADRIYMLSDGEVLANGSYQELLMNEPAFRDLHGQSTVNGAEQ